MAKSDDSTDLDSIDHDVDDEWASIDEDHSAAIGDSCPTGPGPSGIRISIVLGLIAIVLLGLVGRVAYLQTAFASRAAERAERQQHGLTTLHARRGSIFDRQGLMLAGSLHATTLFADPWFMHEQFAARGLTPFDMDLALEHVAKLIDADPNDIALRVGRDPSRRYVRLARGLSDEMVEQLREMQIPGLGFEAEPRRFYPMGQTAAHILGTVGWAEAGLEGVERIEEARLAGSDGSVRTTRDKRRRAIAAPAAGYNPPEHGRHLILTIDSNIQLIAQQELEAALSEFQAVSGSVVVMDPHTGDILALANAPTFFPQYLADSDPDARRNRAIVDPYEPGSVIKPFVVAGLLDSGILRLDRIFDTEETRFYRTPYRRTIRDITNYEKLAVWDVLVKSSNIGMVKIGEHAGDAAVRQALERFEFGTRTGVALDGEDPGRLMPLNRWNRGYSRDSVVMGYEMLATPLQLARGMCALANGGRLVTPRLVAGWVDTDGHFIPEEQEDLDPEVIRPETAAAILRVLADTPIRGTARHARIENWNLFGKTGTARRWVGQYNEQHYNVSFVGGAPYESPRLVIVMTITDPDVTIARYGGLVAAPAAGRILERALDYLDVPHSPPLPPYPSNIRPILHQMPPE